MKTISLSRLKIVLQIIFKFGPTSQIYARTLKFETPIFLFLRTHARALLMAYFTSFFPPVFNRENEALPRSPDYMTII